MKLSRPFDLDSYLISLIIHVSIFMLLGLITFNVPKHATELMVEWLTDENPEVIQEDFAPPGEVQTNDNTQALNQNTLTNDQQNPVTEKISPIPTTAKSIEAPVYRKPGKVNSAPQSGTSSSYLTGVKSQLQGSQQGGNGYQLDNDDGNIIILKQVLPKPTINDYGKVTLQFKIKQNGTVDSESIVPVLIDDPNYTNESIIALRQWLFSYKSYNSSKAYRISFIFNPE